MFLPIRQLVGAALPAYGGDSRAVGGEVFTRHGEQDAVRTATGPQGSVAIGSDDGRGIPARNGCQNVTGQTLPAGRDISIGELSALVRACVEDQRPPERAIWL